MMMKMMRLKTDIIQGQCDLHAGTIRHYHPVNI